MQAVSLSNSNEEVGMRIYSWSDKRRERVKCLLVMVVGCALGLWCVYGGVTFGSLFLVVCGAAFFCLNLVATILLVVRVDRMFAWCYANTLEVSKDVVVRYHCDPFFYKPKELGETQLIPVNMRQVSVVKKIRIPVQDRILTYRIECVVAIDNFQRFYDFFLRDDGCDKRIPEVMINEALSALLDMKRDEMARLCFAYREEEFDVQAANIQMVMYHKVRRFLQETFVRYGLDPITVRPWCSVDPYIIE